MIETYKLVETDKLIGIYEAPEKITKIWEGIAAVTNSIALLYWLYLLVVRLCKHVLRAISSLVKKNK